MLSLALFALAGCRAGSRNHDSANYPIGVPLLAVSEEHGETTDFWLIDPRDQSQRWKFATIPHKAEWGARASVAPDGKTLVYSALPKGASDPNTQAELWALPISGRNARRLATGIDLRSGLAWSPDSRWVSYDRSSGSDGQMRRVNVLGAGDQLLVRSSGDSRWYIMGYEPDGRSVDLAHLSPAGTEIVQQAVGGAQGRGIPVAALPSRDFTVSPGGHPAMLVLTNEDGRKVFRAVALLGDGGFVRLTAGGSEDTGIAWDPRTGEPTVGVVPRTPGEQVIGMQGATVLVPASGFDVPLAWSPDSAFLAVRHFSGRSTDLPEMESLVLVGAGGGRTEIKGKSPEEFVGWMNAGR